MTTEPNLFGELIFADEPPLPDYAGGSPATVPDPIATPASRSQSRKALGDVDPLEEHQPVSLTPAERDFVRWLWGSGLDVPRLYSVLDRFTAPTRNSKYPVPSPIEQLRRYGVWRLDGHIPVAYFGNLDMPPLWPTEPQEAIVLVVPAATEQETWGQYRSVLADEVKPAFDMLRALCSKESTVPLLDAGTPRWHRVQLASSGQLAATIDAKQSYVVAAACTLVPGWGAALLSSKA